jgi:hypothetical protein
MKSSSSLPDIGPSPVQSPSSRRRGLMKEMPPFSISILEDEKFKVKLQHMMGDMSKFNGQLVNPTPVNCQALADGIVKEKRSALQAYEVELDPRTKCVVTADMLGVHEDLDYLRNKAQAMTLQKSKTTGNNRSSVSMALSSLITQVRKKVHEQMKNKGESAMDQFRQFDTDKSGEIDEIEFMEALKVMGIQISKKEIQMVFRCLDSNETGGIDLNEWESLVGGGKGGNSYVKDNHVLCTYMSAERRSSRIRAATVISQSLPNSPMNSPMNSPVNTTRRLNPLKHPNQSPSQSPAPSRPTTPDAL